MHLMNYVSLVSIQLTLEQRYLTNVYEDMMIFENYWKQLYSLASLKEIDVSQTE